VYQTDALHISIIQTGKHQANEYHTEFHKSRLLLEQHQQKRESHEQTLHRSQTVEKYTAYSIYIDIVEMID